MNKVILMGRLARDPETRYSKGEPPVAVSKFSLAVNRTFKRDNEPSADFIPCTAFGKTGEFVEKYFRKGQMVSVVGKIQISSWEDQNNQKRWSTDVIVEEVFFAESKSSFEANKSSQPQQFDNSAQKSQADDSNVAFYSIDQAVEDDDDLPF